MVKLLFSLKIFATLFIPIGIHNYSITNNYCCILKLKNPDGGAGKNDDFSRKSSSLALNFQKTTFSLKGVPL